MHIAAVVGPDLLTSAEAKSPDGNAVSVDKELGKSADTQQAQNMALNLYGKYASFFRLAMGRSS
jgi:flagellar basal body rod protein FlgB